MIPLVDTRYVALVLVFVLCQVIGTMCTLPDLSVAEETAILVEEGMACPMDGATMCPPSFTSSPERKIKNSTVMDVDHETILLSPAAVQHSSLGPDGVVLEQRVFHCPYLHRFLLSPPNLIAHRQFFRVPFGCLG